MPDATISRYEVERNVLPTVCAKCGVPATTRAQRPVPVPLRKRTLAWAFPLGMVLYLAVPMSIIIFIRLLPHTGVGVPVCDAHQVDWAWRERVRTRYLWPVVCIASLAVEIMCLTGLLFHPVVFAHAAAGVLVVGFLLDWLIVGRGVVTVFRAGKDQFRLSRVHSSFVTALIEDRARDRVDNPERRSLLRGDLRDDFDDEPV